MRQVVEAWVSEPPTTLKAEVVMVGVSLTFDGPSLTDTVGVATTAAPI